MLSYFRISHNIKQFLTIMSHFWHISGYLTLSNNLSQFCQNIVIHQTIYDNIVTIFEYFRISHDIKQCFTIYLYFRISHNTKQFITILLHFRISQNIKQFITILSYFRISHNIKQFITICHNIVIFQDIWQYQTIYQNMSQYCQRTWKVWDVKTKYGISRNIKHQSGFRKVLPVTST